MDAKKQKSSTDILSKNTIGLEITLSTSTTGSLKRISTTQWQQQNAEQILSGQCHERDRIQHEIQMTDDLIYRDWYKRTQKQKEIDEYGIDED